MKFEIYKEDSKWVNLTIWKREMVIKYVAVYYFLTLKYIDHGQKLIRYARETNNDKATSSVVSTVIWQEFLFLISL